MNAKTRDQAICLIDGYLTFVSCANKDLRKYDKSLLMTPDFCDTGILPDDPVSYRGVTAADLEHAWTVRVLGQVGEGGREARGAMFAIYEEKTVGRGEASRFSDRVPNNDLSPYECFSRHTEAVVYGSGDVEERVVYVGFRGRQKTIFDPGEQLVVGGLLSRRRDELTLQSVEVSLGLAFMLPSFWQAHVAISDDSPRISLLTDPTGVKELWKFRELPEGKARRDALLHWVSNHWRRNRQDPDVEGYVRSCLRGSRALKCSGLSVEVSESEEDREKLLKIIQARHTMRRAGRDRRRRISR